MIDIQAWAEYVVEWAAKDPYGFLTTVILALTPLFIASALLSWKLAKMIEARDREQKKKQKRQENIAKAKRTKKDWACEGRMRAWNRQPPRSQPSLFRIMTWCPSLSQPYRQHRATTPHVRGRRRDTWPQQAEQCETDSTAQRRLVSVRLGQQEHSGNLYDIYKYIHIYTEILW